MLSFLMRSPFALLAIGAVLFLYLRQRQTTTTAPAVLINQPALQLPERETASAPSQEETTFAPLRQQTGAPIVAVRSPDQSTFELIKRFEGFRPEAYRDAGGWSIGYGTFMGTSPSMQYVTPDQAESLLQQTVYKNTKEMLRLLTVPVSRNQFDALQSFVYNVGLGNFTKSTLLKKLNAGDYNGAAQEFMRWVYSGQTMLRALIQRRAAERDLFTTP